MGTIYYVELERPLGDPTRPRCSARFYVGYAESSVKNRMAQHRRGTGSKMLKAANNRGIKYKVVFSEPGTRDEERRVKSNGHFEEVIARKKARKHGKA